MTWAKIETGYLANQKVLRLSAQATLLHLASVLWSHDQETDGWVPEHVIPLLCAHAHGASPHDAEMLSSLGLWEAGPGGYWVHDFLRHQDSAATRENEREQARERQRKRRESQEVSRRDIGRESRNREEKRREERDKEPPLPPTNGTVVDLPKRKTARPKPGGDEEFQNWYAQYPKRVDRGHALAAWNKALRNGATVDLLTAGVRRYAAEVQGKDRQYIKNPATWLNGQCWNDDHGGTTPPAGLPATARMVGRCLTCRQDVFEGEGCRRHFPPEVGEKHCDRWKEVNERTEAAGVPRVDHG